MEFEKIRSAVRLAEYAVVNRRPLRTGEDALRALSEELLVGPWLIMRGFWLHACSGPSSLRRRNASSSL